MSEQDEDYERPVWYVSTNRQGETPSRHVKVFYHDQVFEPGLGQQQALQDTLNQAESLASGLYRALEEGLLVFVGFHHHDESAFDAMGKCNCGGMEWYGSTLALLSAYKAQRGG